MSCRSLDPSPALFRLLAGESTRPLAWVDGQGVDLAGFLRHVHGVAAWLPTARHVVNLCDDRYRFLVLLCAAAVRGQVTLLPPSRAPAVVAQIAGAHAGCSLVTDQPEVAALLPGQHCLPATLPAADGGVPLLPADQVLVIGYTSGSTGVPQANPKTWGSFVASTAQNMQQLSRLCGGQLPQVVATVPPQHMYGMELSVLLPLLGPACIHAGRPFFPQDVAQALAQVPPPRLLVTTPVHLRALVQAGVELPALAGIITATAPLPVPLAQAAEAAFAAPVQEMFGSTETCIFATRRTAQTAQWTPLAGVRVQPLADGMRVSAPHLEQPRELADLVRCTGDGRFELIGRRADLVEIAGKRASLGDLTARLLALPGVADGVMLQLPAEPGQPVGRIAALVVAPGREEAELLGALRQAMDPVFLPRPLRRVPALPRNETGKLPRDALLALLQAG